MCRYSSPLVYVSVDVGGSEGQCCGGCCRAVCLEKLGRKQHDGAGYINKKAEDKRTMTSSPKRAPIEYSGRGLSISLGISLDVIPRANDAGMLAELHGSI
jgi:hypothetical protein